MRRLILLCLLLCSCPMAAKAQIVIDDYYNSCLGISKIMSSAIPEYYGRQQAGTIDSLLYIWKAGCGSIDPLMFFEIEYAIGSESFDEGFYDDRIIPSLKHYYDEFYAPDRLAGKPHAEDFGVDSNYYTFIATTARDLFEDGAGRNPLEYWLLRYLAKPDTSLFSELDNEIYNNTVLQYSYREWRRQLPGAKGNVDFSSQLSGGVWSPDGGLQRIGNHPVIELEIGAGSETFNMGLYLNVRFGKTPEPYKVFADSLMSTRYHFGTGLGFNARYTVRNGRHSDVLGLGTIGYDVLTLRPDPDTDDQMNTAVNRKSLLLGIGAGYRYFVGHHLYFALEGKYNLLFYNNPHGSDLSGNVFMVTLSIGQSGGSYKGRLD